MYRTFAWPPQHHWFNLIWSLFLQRVSFWVYHLCQIEKLSSGKKKQLYTLPGTNVWYPIHPGSCKDEFPTFPIWWEIHFPNRTYPKKIIFGSRNTFSKLKVLGVYDQPVKVSFLQVTPGACMAKSRSLWTWCAPSWLSFPRFRIEWSPVGRGEPCAPYTNSLQEKQTFWALHVL